MDVYIFYDVDSGNLYAMTKSKEKARIFENTRNMKKFIKKTIDMEKDVYKSDKYDDYHLKYFELKDELNNTTRVLSTNDEMYDINQSCEDTFLYLMSRNFVKNDIESNMDLTIFKEKYSQILLSLKLDGLIELMIDDDSCHIPFDIFEYNKVALYCALYKDLYRKGV